MWKVYRRRHLWLFQVFSLFSALYGSFKGDGTLVTSAQHTAPHGRHILSVDNTSTLPVSEGIGVGVVPDCIPPSLEEFPDDFFTQEQRARGGIVVHLLIVAYVCAMLAIVCDKYFVPCLNVISAYFRVPSDIAGATFMAVGASSPELFSSVIGAFVTEGDIGVGTVVGSAVFNILAVTGAAAFTVGSAAVEIDWYPITRDSTMYIITISALVFIIHDNLVTWIEALILICMFLSYLIILFFNSRIHDVTTKKAKVVQAWWLTKKGVPMDGLPLYDEKSALLVANRLAHRYGDSACPSSVGASFDASSEMTDSGRSDTFHKESGQYRQPPLLVPQLIPQKYIVVHDLDDDLHESVSTMKKLNNDLEESLAVHLWEKPKGSWLQKFFFLLMWMPNFLFSITVPMCNTPERIRYFPLTFLGSILWLGTLSYMCFWMVAIIGYTLGIPDTISGLTILAAGTCVPELVSSVIVVRNGLGNMALCNLLGSNIFDILFCLGVPWLIKTLMNSDTKSLVINSSALTYTTLILLVVALLFYLTLVLCRWRLDWRYGIVAFVLYACFLVTASMFEGNVFGDFNPPTCGS